MKMFDWLSVWWRLFRVTSALFGAFDSIFKPFSAANLRKEMHGDEFVVAYMYGVMVHFFDLYGTVGLQPGQVMWKCYERVFPGHGKDIVKLTVMRVQAKDQTFLHDIRTGTRETREYLAKKGTGAFPTLTGHLTTRYS